MVASRKKETTVSGQDEYCDLCDLLLSECIHGMPKPVVEPEAPKPVRTRTRKVAAPGQEPTVRTKPAPVVTTHAATRRWTAAVDFVPHILAVLAEAGGSLETEAALRRVEQRMSEQLRPGDHEQTPQGDLRWRVAARKARRDLVEEGLLKSEPGVWRLAD